MIAGQDWFNLFIKKYPELSVRAPKVVVCYVANQILCIKYVIVFVSKNR